MSTLQGLSSRTLQRNLSFGILVCPASSRRSYSKRTIKGIFCANFAGPCSNVLAENDIVLLKHRTNLTTVPVLTNCLRVGNLVPLGRDSIAHDDILGKEIRDLVVSKKRIQYRIFQPTLSEYTDLSPRIVTPVSYCKGELIYFLIAAQ
jgi:hypothetical protein